MAVEWTMGYTNKEGAAEIASPKRLVSTGDIAFEISGGHTSLPYVTHSGDEQSDTYNPTVVSA